MVKELRFADVSAIYMEPDDAHCVYVLAHGAGAGMRHTFMETIANRLFAAGVATFRYQFPYMELGRKRPDSAKVAQATVRAAVACISQETDLPLIAGGKSFGGRMTSQAQSAEPLEGVRALAFLGFPLHASGKPSKERATHLYGVEIPMLFLQGTRDSLATLDQLEPVIRNLGEKATLHIVEAGDHSFKVTKKSGRSPDDVMNELVGAFVEFAATRAR